MGDNRKLKPVIAAGTVIGVGLGGLIDGIFLHQIAQVHSMLSAKRPLNSMGNMRTNMTADGLFHAIMLLVTIAGILMLFNAGRRTDVAYSTRAFVGAMIMGWGAFNLVEGIINHQILGLHHVVERLGPSVWDWVFLAASGALVFAGWKMTLARRI